MHLEHSNLVIGIMGSTKNKKSEKSINSEYYEVPHELITIFIVLSLGFIMPVVLYAPQWLPSGKSKSSCADLFAFLIN